MSVTVKVINIGIDTGRVVLPEPDVSGRKIFGVAGGKYSLHSLRPVQEGRRQGASPVSPSLSAYITIAIQSQSHALTHYIIIVIAVALLI